MNVNITLFLVEQRSTNYVVIVSIKGVKTTCMNILGRILNYSQSHNPPLTIRGELAQNSFPSSFLRGTDSWFTPKEFLSIGYQNAFRTDNLGHFGRVPFSGREKSHIKGWSTCAISHIHSKMTGSAIELDCHELPWLLKTVHFSAIPILKYHPTPN